MTTSDIPDPAADSGPDGGFDATVDLTPDFLAAVRTIGTELVNVRGEVSAQIALESKTRGEQISAEADIRARSDRRYRRLVLLDIALSVLIGVGYGGLWQSNHDRQVANHRAALSACATTNTARAGIRQAFITEDKVWASLLPAVPTPEAVRTIAGIHAKFVAAEASIPAVDCSKIK